MAEEYIAREELLKGIRDAGGDGGVGNLVAGVLELYVKSVPAADVAPVVHARWEYIGGDEWRCTHCGNVRSTEGRWEPVTDPFCAECGAKMDLEG